MKLFLKLFPFLLIFTAVSPGIGLSEIVRSAHVEAELITETQTVKPGTPLSVGLRMKMAAGWHTYWKNPGDSGLPTSIAWDLPAGVTASEIFWPIPHKITTGDLTTYGFDGEVALLTQFQIPENFSDKTFVLHAKADWLACEAECIPGSGNFAITIPVENAVPQADPKWVELFAKTRSLLPVQLPEINVTAFASEKGLKLRVTSSESHDLKQIRSLEWLPVRSDLILHSAKQKLKHSDSSLELWIKRSDIFEGELQTISGVLIAEPGWRGSGSEKGLTVENVSVQPLTENFSGSSPQDFSASLPFILFAFLGGLILNLMPCVLPVLSLKILGIIDQSKQKKSGIIFHGISFTAGVLVCFWALAVLLLILRNSGEQIGWGFQLQQPEFVLFLVFLFFAMSLNLFGVFEVGVTLTGLGQKTPNQKGLLGSFVSGLLATVVATPCTAPFMGSALAFAFSSSHLIAFLIFTFLGLGMAFPYLILTLNPKFIQWIPKPGPWMVGLKKILGTFLFLTSLWLLWILKAQTSHWTLVVTLGGIIGVGIASWIYGKWGNPAQTKKTKQFAQIIAALIIFIAAITSYQSIQHASFLSEQKNQTGILWKKYEPGLADQAVSEGKTVFIDFTAAWCLSCQVNDVFALRNQKVVEAFNNSSLLPLKADWTQRDSAITDALSRYGRSSIPLYVILSPSRKEPYLLPEIITPKIVLDSLEQAKKPDH